MRRYYAFQMLVAFQLFSPFWTLWLFAHADYFQATLIDVAFWIVSLLVAMPAGAIADRYGRKRAMILGVGIWTFGIVLFGLSTTFETFALANGVWAFGAGFLWGAGSAYLYDTLLEVRLEARYPSLSGRVELFAFLGTALACALGGVVVTTWGRLDLPLILYGIVGAAAMVLALTFQEPTVPRETAVNVFAQIRGGLKTAAANRQIVLIILFQVLIGLVTYVMGFFRPRFIDDIVRGDYLVMGLVYAGFFSVAACAGLTVGRLLGRFGESGALVLIFLLVFPPFALVYAVSRELFAPLVALGLGVVTQASFYFVWGIEAPVVTTIVNRRVASGDRATVLAISTFFVTLVIAIVEPLVGLVATDYDIGVGLAALALVASLPTAYVVLAYRRGETPAAKPLPSLQANHGR